MPANVMFDPASGAWMCSFKYDQAALTALKQQIPYAGRVWKPDTKQWIIDNMYIDVFRAIANDFLGGTIEGKAAPPPPKASVATKGGSQDFQDFLLLCHYDDLKTLYRSTMKRHHPDNGGNVQEAAMVTVLWNTLEPKITRR